MTKAFEFLTGLPGSHDRGQRVGITSVCSAHPLVIKAAMAEASETGQPLLIEATCNQVNQEGGYTDMTPADFAGFVLNLAATVDFPIDQILLGGDHLGPNPWRDKPAEYAMEKAVVMTHDYAAAGFGKIHLDASMACSGDPEPLPPETIASRAANLAQAAEAGAKAGGHESPIYVIGTEVPIPGGVAEQIQDLEVTRKEDANQSLAVHQAAFSAKGLDAVFQRCVGLVVQPGVEYGSANVIAFNPEKAGDLANWRDQHGGFLFEAHSTDYQTTVALAALVQGGFGILKVGPGLTFAMREAFYGLDAIAAILDPSYPAGQLQDKMEQLTVAKPDQWNAYYFGTKTERQFQRHFSFSDRIRYYWNDEIAADAVKKLFSALEAKTIPAPLISQYMPRLFDDVQSGAVKALAPDLVQAAIRKMLNPYSRACSVQDV